MDLRDTMLALHFIGLAMGLGTSFAHTFLGKALTNMTFDEAKKFNIQLKGLSQMGSIGTLLLIISGVYLILPFWPVILSMPLLIVKLVLFVLLVFLIIVIGQLAQKDVKNNNQDNLKRIELMGKATLVVALAIVTVAVNIFH